MKPSEVRALIEDAGGTVEEIHGPLLDGSGFAVGSFPLPKTHWLYAEDELVPPTPIVESYGANAAWWRARIVEASRYAVRSATGRGTIVDFDPDALVQAMLLALVGPRPLPPQTEE